MKKLFILILGIFFMFGIVACTETTTTQTTTAATTTTTEQTTTEDTTQTTNTTELDTTAPVISGAVDIDYTTEDPAPDYLASVSAEDDVDGDLTDEISVDDSAVDLSTPGSYDLIYTVEDAAGNETSVTVSVNVTLREMSAEEKVAADLAAIDLDASFKFPLFGTNGSVYTWTSDTPDVVTNKGSVIRPGVNADPVTVTITVVATNGTASDTRDIEYVVQPQAEGLVTSSRLVPFTSESEEWTVAEVTDVELFFINDGTVPYMDVIEFLTMQEGAIASTEFVFTPVDSDKLQISYEVEYEDFDGSMVTELHSALIDFTLNTMTLSSYAFNENYSVATETDFGEGLIYVDWDFTPGTEVTIPLGDYNFDLLTYDRGEDTFYLMPVTVMNLIFNSSLYYNVYYNGDQLYGIDYWNFSDDEVMELTRTSSYNSLNMAQDMKDAVYHFLALSFDYFYGLKHYFGIDSFYEYLLTYADSLLSKSDGTIYNTIFDIVYSLDDLHTYHYFSGYYAEPEYTDDLVITDLGQLGPRTQAFYQSSWQVDDWLEAKWGSLMAVPQSRVLSDGKTAVFYFTQFTADTPDDFYRFLSTLDPAIENVVIDLTNNGGGNSGAVSRMFGYMTEQAFTSHYQNPNDGETVTYYIESDYVAFNYNWYILSSKVSFSAANKMISTAKELGIATIVGQDSGGGACSIIPVVTPDGSIFVMSSLSMISTRSGNEIDGYVYTDVEMGVEVDYWMENPQDDDVLIGIIQQDQNPA